MSEDMKKSLRTQGRFSDKSVKNRDKRQKESPADKEPPGKKSYSQKRNSTGHQNKSETYNELENDSPVKYEENSHYSFSKLDDAKKPIEINSSGLRILSETCNGTSSILYEPYFIDEDEGDELFKLLQDTTAWNTKNIVIRGVEYPQPRLVAWYGPFPYSYAGVTLEATEMPESVLLVKDRIEDFLKLKGINVSLNSVLLNLYRNGKDSVAWHSDDELTMGICPTIASVSLGAPRKFEMKRREMSYDDNSSEEDYDQFFVNLTHGSLLIMNGCMQKDWLHRVPKEYHDKPPRINLTFRTVYSLDKSPAGYRTKESKFNISKINSSGGASSSQVSFNDDDFPPLDGTISLCSSNEENDHEISKSSNLSASAVEDDEKSMEYSDTSNSNQKSSSLLNDSHSFHNPLVNNLNDDTQYLKHDLLNKNIQSNIRVVDENDVMNADDSSDRNQSFGSSTSQQDVSMDSVDAPPTNVYANDIHVGVMSKLNVNAEEFYPPVSPSLVPVPNFRDFELPDLIDHYPDLEDEELEPFIIALKTSVRDNINKFAYYEQEQLNFLCSLMDDELPDLTLKKVTGRMYDVLQRILGKYYSRQYRNPSYKSRPHSGVPRQEYREGQQNVSHPSAVRKHSYKGDRRTNQEDAYFSKRETHTSQEDACSSRRGEMHTSQEDASSSRREMRTSQEDTYSRNERQNTRKEDYSYRGRRQNNYRGRYQNRGERRSSGGDGSTNQGRRSFRQ